MATTQKSRMRGPRPCRRRAVCANRFSTLYASFKKRVDIGFAAVIFPLALSTPTARASTTIDRANRYAYGADIGWSSLGTNGAPKVELRSGRDRGLGLICPDGPTMTRTLRDTDYPNRFYRVRAVLPLSL